MNIRASIFVGVAASALFYLIQKYLLGWPYPWDIISTAAVLLAAALLAALLTRAPSNAPKEGTSILSNIETGKGMNATIDGLETREPPDKILSNLNVEGDAEFEIKNTKI